MHAPLPLATWQFRVTVKCLCESPPRKYADDHEKGNFLLSRSNVSLLMCMFAGQRTCYICITPSQALPHSKPPVCKWRLSCIGWNMCQSIFYSFGTWHVTLQGPAVSRVRKLYLKHVYFIVHYFFQRHHFPFFISLPCTSVGIHVIVVFLPGKQIILALNSCIDPLSTHSRLIVHPKHLY
jgi:hypothetical protein